MGRDKALLPFGPGEVLLQRIARLVAEVVPASRIVCMAAPGQSLPPLPAGVHVAFDSFPHEGPLAGLAQALSVVEKEAEAVFLSACDAPLLAPAFVEWMFQLLGDYEIAAPHDGRHWYPLAAVYRTQLRPRAESLLAGGQRSLVALVEACHSRRVEMEELRAADPALASLATCNTPHEYQSALRAAGLHASQ